jgi:hypothetical protein
MLLFVAWVWQHSTGRTHVPAGLGVTFELVGLLEPPQGGGREGSAMDVLEVVRWLIGEARNAPALARA